MSVALERQYAQWNAAAIKGSATMRLNETYVKDNTGQTYELRYDPNSGTSAIVGHKEVVTRRGTGRSATSRSYETIVLFESTPEGGKFTEKGQALLDAGNIQKLDGTSLGEQVLRNTIQNDTQNAYKKTDLRRKAQGYSVAAVETSALAAGSTQPPAPAVTGTEGGPEAASTSAANPDATPQPDAVPTDAGGEGSDKQPANIFQTGVDALNNVIDGALSKVGLDRDKANSFFLTQPDPETLRKIAEQFSTSDAAITAIAEKGIQYPIDGIFGGPNSQDYALISQYTYRPPSANTIFSKSAVDNVTKGVQRITALSKRLGYVKLPMPNDVTDSNNVNWGEDAINSLSAAITSAVTSDPLGVAAPALIGAGLGAATGIQGLGKLGAGLGVFANAGGTEGLGKLFQDQNAKMVIGSALSSRLLSLAGVNVSPETLLSRGLGVVPNQNMELLFNSPTLRTFVFNWKLAARSRAEAVKINNIVRFFKQGMAVKTTAAESGGASLLLGTPNVFKMKFMTRNKTQLEGVGRIKECAITGVSMNYTPEGKWSAYDDGQPTSVLMTIRMQELEPVYASDYINGTDPAAGSRNPDYDKIRANEVGY